MCTELRGFIFRKGFYIFLVILSFHELAYPLLASRISKNRAPRLPLPSQNCTFGATPVVGETCGDGSVYIGRDSANRILVTPPGNCSHEPGGTHTTTPSAPFIPTCTGTIDASVAKAWGTEGITSGIVSTTDGLTNTSSLALNYTTTRAAKYCYFMRYGGFADWYLPAKAELNLFWANRVLLNANPTTGMRADSAYYWSSTEYNYNWAWVQRFDNGTQFNGGNKINSGTGNLVRCIRRQQ